MKWSENFSNSVVSNALWPRGARQAPLSMEFSRQEYWSDPFPSPGDLPNPGIEPGCPVLQEDFYCLSQQEHLSLCIC